MAKRPLVVGNWKLYLEKPEEAARLLSSLKRRWEAFSGVDVVVAPPFPLLPAAARALKGTSIRLGAQAVSSHEGGAHTGEVSALLLGAVGCSLVIVGHSERRAAGETDDSVRDQLHQVLAAKLQPVLCVGERERDAVDGSHFAYIEAQLTSALAGVPASAASSLIVAYEPVWAIGKSAIEAANPALVQEMAIFIRRLLSERFGRTAAARVPVLYGGSVEADNARALLVEGGVAGFLVGRASTQAATLIELLAVCKNR